MSHLEGKNVIMTGSSSGIGEGTAVFFASKGCNVTLCGRDAGRLQEAIEKCRHAALEAGHMDSRFVSVAGDLKESEVRTRLLNNTVEAFGGIDVLVSNHAVLTKEDNLSGITENAFDTTLNTNVKSVLFLIKEATPFLEQTKGCVIIVSSIGSTLPTKGNLLVYGCTKAVLDYMVRSLAIELGPKGIRINTVNPTYVPTRILRDNFNDPDNTDVPLRLFSKVTPLSGQESGVNEQAEVIAFLASKAARFVTGISIKVDGGVSCVGNPFNFPELLEK